MISLTERPIDPNSLTSAVQSPAAGAVVLFLGTARESSGGRSTASLDYEAYREMAERELATLVETARHRWDLVGCEVTHRVGRVELGEICVAIAVSSAHREAAFSAGKWLIDTIKETVPIWKRENWADGESEWVHPGLGGEVPDA